MAIRVFAGEYGGRVTRGFKGDGQSFITGATITPEMVKDWPLANRMALQVDGKVEWFGPPSDAENKAREAGKPATARGVVAKPAAKAPAATTATGVAATNRRVRPAR
jgi:hypothetical protein